MKFYDYKEYRDYYTAGLEWLGDAGEYNYYYDKNEEHTVRIESESHSTWNIGDKPHVKTYYGKQAKAIKEVFDKKWDDEYEYVEDFEFDLDYATDDRNFGDLID